MNCIADAVSPASEGRGVNESRQMSPYRGAKYPMSEFPGWRDTDKHFAAQHPPLSPINSQSEGLPGEAPIGLRHYDHQ
jgi:hypothetical protein